MTESTKQENSVYDLLHFSIFFPQYPNVFAYLIPNDRRSLHSQPDCVSVHVCNAAGHIQNKSCEL